METFQALSRCYSVLGFGKKKGFWRKTAYSIRSHFLFLEIRDLQDGIANFFRNREKNETTGTDHYIQKKIKSTFRI